MNQERSEGKLSRYVLKERCPLVTRASTLITTKVGLAKKLLAMSHQEDGNTYGVGQSVDTPTKTKDG